ncbi:MAG: peptide MFS transporter [Chitinophagaceae bacterium]|nr:peptide MFS transporter [Chitinophagaceae bacterium]
MDLGLILLIGGWVFVILWVPLVVLSQHKIHPRPLFTLFFAELWERFSFYGMRAFLVLYMTSELFNKMSQGEADARAYGVYGAFNALLYAAPIVGGMIADRIFGFKRAILTGGIMMASAQFLLALNAWKIKNETLFFLALGLLAIGNGFFKPNISSFLGTFYDRNDKRKDSAFTIFYMGINIGALLAPLTCGYLARKVDWSLGFFLAGVGMLAGLIVFYGNRSIFGQKGNAPDPHYLHQPKFMGLSPNWLILLGSLLCIPLFSLLINNEGITNYIMIIAGIICIGYLLYTSFQSEDKIEGQRLLVFIFLFFFHMLFWVLFEQAGGSINILTDRYVNKLGIETSQFQAVNPLFIILLAPVFTWIWTTLSRRNKEPRTPIKFTLALLQIALGYFIIVVATRNAASSGQMISLVFLILMYLFHTTGELSLSPVGLSVVTKLSPAKVVGFVMGCWFLSIAFAHKIAGYLGQLIAAPKENASREQALYGFANIYMTWGVWIVLGAAALLFILSPMLKKWMHGVN